MTEKYPPIGRAMNPTAKVLNDASGGSPAAKETVGKTSAAAVPYRKKPQLGW